MIMPLLIIIISLLISVAFFTIIERKFLSYTQTRKGPNKVGMMGILQPFSDAIKLFSKTANLMTNTNKFFSLLAPSCSLILTTLFIPLIPMNSFSEMDIKQNLILFLILASLSVYIILLIGWAMNSKYSLLGAIRSIAQMISYEVAIFLLILFMVILTNSYAFFAMNKAQTLLWFTWGNSMILVLWLLATLAEMNRSPFDFAEGESELVSGFNVEYMGGFFALIFLAEYMSIIIMSIITILLFLGTPNKMVKFFLLILMTLFTLWVRSTFPRLRYDILMKLNWKMILPTILFMIMTPTLFCTMF